MELKSNIVKIIRNLSVNQIISVTESLDPHFYDADRRDTMLRMLTCTALKMKGLKAHETAHVLGMSSMSLIYNYLRRFKSLETRSLSTSKINIMEKWYAEIAWTAKVDNTQVDDTRISFERRLQMRENSIIAREQKFKVNEEYVKTVERRANKLRELELKEINAVRRTIREDRSKKAERDKSFSCARVKYKTMADASVRKLLKGLRDGSVDINSPDHEIVKYTLDNF